MSPRSFLISLVLSTLALGPQAANAADENHSRRATVGWADPVGGPQVVLDIAPGYWTNAYTITLRSWEETVITVIGDGCSDLDLYVYDSTGSLVAKDIGLSDRAQVRVMPAWTSDYRVEVKNCGPAANFFLLSAE